MKDSQLKNGVRLFFDKYIKANNERFSTADKSGAQLT